MSDSGKSKGSGGKKPTAESQKGRDAKTGQFTKGGEKKAEGAEGGEGSETPAPDAVGELFGQGAGAEVEPGAEKKPEKPEKPDAKKATPKPAASENPGTGKITVLGKEYDLPNLENMIRTLQGQFKTFQQQVAQKEQIAAAWREQAYRRGYSEGPNDPVAAQFAGQQQSGVQSQVASGAAQKTEAGGTAPGANSSDDDVFAGIDLALYGDLAKERGPMAAAYYLVRETAKKMRSEFKKELETAAKPGQEVTSQLQRARQQAEIVGQLSQITDAEGKQRYPELADPNVARQVVQFWGRLPWTDEHKYTPLGLHQTVLAYRDAVAGQTSEGGEGSTLPGSDPSTPLEGEAASDAGEGSEADDSSDAAKVAEAAAAALESETPDADGDDAIDASGDGSASGGRRGQPLHSNPEVAAIFKDFQVDGDEDIGFRRE